MKNLNITPQDFYLKFKNRLLDPAKLEYALMAYGGSWAEDKPTTRKHPWTVFLDNELSALLAEYGLKSYSEFYRIDITGWDKEETWKLRVACEYENSQDAWLYEFKKLCYIKCDLKVVFGYTQRHLNSLKKAVESMNQISDVAKLREDEQFLVILGCYSKEYKSFEDMGLVGYFWNGSEFKKIEV